MVKKAMKRRPRLMKVTKSPTLKKPGEEPVEFEPIKRKESEWKEDIARTKANSKICIPCLKRNTCPFGRGAAVILCDKIEISKKKRMISKDK